LKSGLSEYKAGMLPMQPPGIQQEQGKVIPGLN
jgi:hypothetical protein